MLATPIFINNSHLLHKQVRERMFNQKIPHLNAMLLENLTQGSKKSFRNKLEFLPATLILLILKQ